MAKDTTPSKARILQIARAKGEFTVHRYAFKHGSLRKKCKKMAEAGELVFVGLRQPLFVYRAPDEKQPFEE